MKAKVTIARKEPETFIGEILAQTDTHLKVQHGVNLELGEWFPIQSNMVTATAIEPKHRNL